MDQSKDAVTRPQSELLNGIAALRENGVPAVEPMSDHGLRRVGGAYLRTDPHLADKLVTRKPHRSQERIGFDVFHIENALEPTGVHEKIEGMKIRVDENNCRFHLGPASTDRVQRRQNHRGFTTQQLVRPIPGHAQQWFEIRKKTRLGHLGNVESPVFVGGPREPREPLCGCSQLFDGAPEITALFEDMSQAGHRNALGQQPLRQRDLAEEATLLERTFARF